MFHPDRWAQAFVNACGEDAGSGLAALKALLACLSRLPAPVTGDYSARQLERMMRYAVSKTGTAGESAAGLETAIRFILLLVKKDRFLQGVKAAGAVETLLCRKNKVLRVRVEAAFPPEAAFEADLKAALIKKTAASEVEAETRIRPELLGGFRLIIGGEAWDASLQGRIQDMARTLEAASGVNQPIVNNRTGSETR
jgi:F-type H+-transporting ATPase subunit delta